jgi:hypothetical protein
MYLRATEMKKMKSFAVLQTLPAPIAIVSQRKVKGGLDTT